MEPFYRYTITDGVVNENLIVHTVGYSQAPPDYAIGPRIRDRYCIHFVFDGRGSFCGEPIGRGDAFLYARDTLHDYRSNPDAPLRYGWIDFNGSNAKELLINAGIGLENRVFTVDNIDEIEELFRVFVPEDCKCHTSRHFMLGCFHILFSFVCSSRKSSNENTDVKRRRIENAVGFIEANYHRRITVADMAAVCYITPHYLSNLFRSELGTSPRGYLLNIRMKRAAELLLIPNLMIGDIARSVGYSDQLVFSKQFKKLYGLSPQAFRAAKNPHG